MATGEEMGEYSQMFHYPDHGTPEKVRGKWTWSLSGITVCDWMYFIHNFHVVISMTDVAICHKHCHFVRFMF